MRVPPASRTTVVSAQRLGGRLDLEPAAPRRAAPTATDGQAAPEQAIEAPIAMPAGS